MEPPGQEDVSQVPERLVNVCGVSNRAGAGLQVCRWPMNRIRIFVDLEFPRFPRSQVIELFDRGARWWTEVAQLDVEWVDSLRGANFHIRMGRGQVDQFDGPQGVLAWCELPCGNVGPSSTLQMKFDSAEDWTAELLLATFIHEIGHGWGIPHSQVKGNIMNPFLNLNQRSLGADDQFQVIQRYGRRSTPPPTPTVPPPITPTEPVPPTSAEGTLILGGKRYRVIPFS